jgi:hypothetical protein
MPFPGLLGVGEEPGRSFRIAAAGADQPQRLGDELTPEWIVDTRTPSELQFGLGSPHPTGWALTALSPLLPVRETVFNIAVGQKLDSLRAHHQLFRWSNFASQIPGQQSLQYVKGINQLHYQVAYQSPRWQAKLEVQVEGGGTMQQPDRQVKQLQAQTQTITDFGIRYRYIWSTLFRLPALQSAGADFSHLDTLKDVRAEQYLRELLQKVPTDSLYSWHSQTRKLTEPANLLLNSAVDSFFLKIPLQRMGWALHTTGYLAYRPRWQKWNLLVILQFQFATMAGESPWLLASRLPAIFPTISPQVQLERVWLRHRTKLQAELGFRWQLLQRPEPAFRLTLVQPVGNFLQLMLTTAWQPRLPTLRELYAQHSDGFWMWHGTCLPDTLYSASATVMHIRNGSPLIPRPLLPLQPEREWSFNTAITLSKRRFSLNIAYHFSLLVRPIIQLPAATRDGSNWQWIVTWQNANASVMRHFVNLSMDISIYKHWRMEMGAWFCHQHAVADSSLPSIQIPWAGGAIKVHSRAFRIGYTSGWLLSTQLRWQANHTTGILPFQFFHIPDRWLLDIEFGKKLIKEYLTLSIGAQNLLNQPFQAFRMDIPRGRLFYLRLDAMF